ncbi:isoaspartyl peptidase/L-asparaginase [Pseudidiomarina sediminum]|uniref:Isoaspartyl peptidase n=1 Tax=Pseudidiomarina sediminum TaxID=431675 RepID=A0A432Z7G5_9GAMM|nr:isoaspartyl peptidase/L-asparaginase [Pseudidiomarina sediminum]RUO73827.1 isoaspartyl peptidase/L-asparaginase [Pseudidiomarina sediminum]
MRKVVMRLLQSLLAAGVSLALSQGVASAEEQEKVFAIAIHGGAGTINKASLTDEQEAAYKAKLSEAISAGHSILAAGGSSMDAVVAAVQVLEDSPLFNAGRGAVYTYDGEHELDASIMNGATGEAGAVAGVKTVKSPIELARSVMENSVHVMLSGEGAEAFAAEQQLALVENSYFNTERRYQQLQTAKEKLGKADKQAYVELDNKYKYGTVGAVALDQEGNLAAATSTGGMTAKRYGRVGDSPIIGAGTWADNASCAVSATGHGEYFIRYHVAADICSRVKYLGESVQEAGDTVIHDVLLPKGGTGGVIIVDGKGNVHMPFNTEGMYRASQVGNGEINVAIYQDELY